MWDADDPKVFRTDTPVARKVHKCCECDGWISKGEKYFAHTGLWDNWTTYKICDDCEQLREKLYLESDEPSLPFTYLCSEIFDSNKREDVVAYLKIRIKRRAKPSNNAWMELQCIKLLLEQEPK